MSLATPALLSENLARRVDAVFNAYTAFTVQSINATLPEPVAEVRRFGRAVAFRHLKHARNWEYNRVSAFDESALEYLPEIRDWYAQAGQPTRIEIIPANFSPTVNLALQAQGFHLDGQDVALAGHLRLGSQPHEPGLTVHEVRLDADFLEFLRVRQLGFEAPPVQPEAVDIQIRRLRQPNSHHFLACAEELPVGVASLFISDKAAYLSLAATLPEHRGKRAHQALLHQRMHHALSLGCDLVVGMTGFASTSSRNMQRAGLGIVHNRMIWRAD